MNEQMPGVPQQGPPNKQQLEAARNMKEIVDALVMLRMKHKIVNVSWAGDSPGHGVAGRQTHHRAAQPPRPETHERG